MALFDEPSRQPLPQPTFDDVSHAGGKVLAGMIPFVGGAAAELIGLLTSPIGARRDAWLGDLQRRLQSLEGRVEGFRFADLADNDPFVSATLQATQAAIRTHQAEKLEALRNAVLNVALGNEPVAERQTVFLTLIDRFTVFHLSVLRMFADPQGYCRQRQIPVPVLRPGLKMLATQLVFAVMPGVDEIAKSPVEDRGGTSFQFADLVLSDLAATNLAALDHHQDTWSVPRFSSQPGPVEVRPLVTHLGEDFLAFITAPAREDAS